MTIQTQSPNHLWTPRWIPLRPHPAQLRLWRSTSRFNIVTAGRRSGKTELAKRKLVEQLAYCTNKGSTTRFLAAAPTKNQAQAIFYNDLLQLLDPNWIDTCRESDLYIETTSGASITIAGLDEPQRIEGIPWTGAIVDEIADCPPGTWFKHLMPALASDDAWAWIVGVPDDEGRNSHEQRQLIRLASADTTRKIWSHHTWSAEDIISPELTDIFRAAMDPRTYHQEIHGQSLPRTSAAFEHFRPEIHVRPCAYNPGLPLNWSLDFNVNPMCSGIFQIILAPRAGSAYRWELLGERTGPPQIQILAELTERHSDTSRACDLFEQNTRLRNWNPTNVGIYGDATGYARDSTSGLDDWSIVSTRLSQYRPTWHVPRSNPTQRTTINAIRALLRSADNKTYLFIDPSCKNLIRDLEEAQWPGDLSQHHHLAWLRYAAARAHLHTTPNEIGGAVSCSRNY